MKLELTNEWDDRDEDGESNGALAAVIFGRNPSSGCPAAAWHSEARPRGGAGSRAAATCAGRRRCSRPVERGHGDAEAGGPARVGDAGRWARAAALQRLGRGGAMGQVANSRCASRSGQDERADVQPAPPDRERKGDGAAVAGGRRAGGEGTTRRGYSIRESSRLSPQPLLRYGRCLSLLGRAAAAATAGGKGRGMWERRAHGLEAHNSATW